MKVVMFLDFYKENKVALKASSCVLTNLANYRLHISLYTHRCPVVCALYIYIDVTKLVTFTS